MEISLCNQAVLPSAMIPSGRGSEAEPPSYITILQMKYLNDILYMCLEEQCLSFWERIPNNKIITEISTHFIISNSIFDFSVRVS